MDVVRRISVFTSVKGKSVVMVVRVVRVMVRAITSVIWLVLVVKNVKVLLVVVNVLSNDVSVEERVRVRLRLVVDEVVVVVRLS